MNDRRRIVILGSGFGGTYAYLEFLKKAASRTDLEVVMVSRDDHFLFVPLLHEVATGNLLPQSISQPIMSLPQERLEDFIQASVTGVDLDSQTVSIVKAEDETDTLSYDYLIYALGSETAYFNVPGAEAHSLPLKWLSDARTIKNRVLELFEQAQNSSNPSEIQKLLRFVIVGGGASGVEMAGELSDFVRNELSEAYPGLARQASIVLTDGSPRLLKALDPWFSKKVCQILDAKRNVAVSLNTPVTEVRPDGIMIGDAFLETRTVIWTAGVRAISMDFAHVHELDLDQPSRRIKVCSHLNIRSYPNVFVAGDSAYILEKETEQPYPMRAQFAAREGVVAARNTLASIDGAPLIRFEWRDQGIILSLGKHGSLAEVYGIRISGPLAWVCDRLAYLSKMYGLKTKTRTLLEWVLNLWTPRDISKI